MGFKKAIEFADTGAMLEHHRVCAVTVDRDAKQSYIAVKSYISKEKLDAGCNHIGYTQLTCPGIPGDKDDLFDWAEQRAMTGEGSTFAGAKPE